jgi:hypothetical protein
LLPLIGYLRITCITRMSGRPLIGTIARPQRQKKGTLGSAQRETPVEPEGATTNPGQPSRGTETHTAHMVMGLLLIGVAAALGAWESMWLAAANPRSRLPSFGWPPNRPFGVLVVYVAIAPTLVLGVEALREDGSHPSALWFFPCSLVVMVAMLVPRGIHNRKVAQIV